MSHFTEIAVAAQQTHEKEFVAALEKQFGEGSVEVSDEGLPLFGYQGDNRSTLPKSSANYAPLCHIRIQRRHVGGASNDVGYRRNEDGTYSAYISEYDQGGHFDADKQNSVAVEYSRLTAHKELKAKGFQVVEKWVKDKATGKDVLRVSGKKW